MEDSGNSHSCGTPDWIKASVLFAVVAVWLVFLGSELFDQVDARFRGGSAALPTVGALVTNFAASSLVPVLLFCAYMLREERDKKGDAGLRGVFLNVLAILIGGSIGWALGVFLVPYDEADGAIYSKIGTGVTAFLSGFVVGYIDQLVRTQLRERPQAFLVQVGLGAAALIVTGLAVTTNRTEYLAFARLERASHAAIEAREKAEIEMVKARFAAQYAELANERRIQQANTTANVLGQLGGR